MSRVRRAALEPLSICVSFIRFTFSSRSHLLLCIATLAKYPSLPTDVVHGDIRGNNLVFGKETAHIIDWDLAGKHEEGKYPDGFVREIPDGARHPQARSRAVMKQSHDWFALAAVMGLMRPEDTTRQGQWDEVVSTIKEGGVEATFPLNMVLTSADAWAKNASL